MSESPKIGDSKPTQRRDPITVAKLLSLGEEELDEADEQDAPPTPGELQRSFPNYEILAVIGRGGMGAVYRARQKTLDRLVAIKLLPLDLGERPDFAVRFEREAHALAKLSHPNIVTVYDYGKTDEGRLFFAMEYVDGRDLADIIRSGELDSTKALAIAAQLCDALAYAHAEGVVHRDIKPANVLVDSRGRAKVADFGLARLVGPEPQNFTLTATGTVLGTVDYMAPEQRGGMNVDHRADIYSLGVILYEMFCRELPQGIFTPPSQRSGCDSRIDEIVNRAMQQEPGRRYENTQEMKAAVEVVRTTDRPLPMLVSAKRRAQAYGMGASVLALGALAYLTLGHRGPQGPVSSGQGIEKGVASGGVRPIAEAKADIQAVIAELGNLNPQWDSTSASWKIDRSQIVELALSAHELKEVSPLSRLKFLKRLQLGRANETGAVKSLEALHRLPLEWLEIHNCKMADLTPLKGMPLRWLVCQGSLVADLTPIKACPLQALGVNDSAVKTLTAVSGLPLRFLNCGRTKVSDLAPLEGMPLVDLNIAYTQVADLTPIAGMELTRLVYTRTPIRDISPIKSMPLTEVECEYDPVRDGEILKSMSTLEKINGMPVEAFWRTH